MYADELYRNKRECGREVELVDSILKKGSIKIEKFAEIRGITFIMVHNSYYIEIRLEALKKRMVGEDTIEEEKQWLELRRHVAQQEGKHSHQYMNKMWWEISVEERTNGGKRKELVDQTEELIRLAHHAHYHQHDQYP